jgi:hypothetical protein
MAGCSSPDGGDAIDDDFLGSGKADGAISEGSPDALGVLAVVNTLDKDALDDDVGLDARAASGIAKHRAAADAALGTADDDRFDTLAELDKVPYVGKTAFTKLLAYARANGFVPMATTGKQVSTCHPEYIIGTGVCGDAAWQYERPTPTGMTLHASQSFGASDVFAAGDQGTVLHYDGTSWKPEQTPICEGIQAMWGTSATNLWAVGGEGRVMHRTAAGWQLVDMGTCNFFQSVWGTSATDVWISSTYDGGHTFHGGTQGFVEVPGVAADSLFGFASDDVWAVDSGRILHYDGSAWTSVYEQHVDFEKIWGSDPDHLFVAGFDWDKNTAAVWMFSEATASTPVEKTFSGNVTPSVGGSAANDVWFAEGKQLHHFDGTTWTYVAQPGGADLYSIAAAGAGAVWAFGYGGEMLRYNGATWTTGNGGHVIYNSWAASENDVWAATSQGLLHYDGTSWSVSPSMTTGFFWGIWGTSPTNIYAAGLFGKFFHYDGTTWSPVTVPVNGSWYSISGTGANDIWASGYQGAVMHFDGTTWKDMGRPTTSKIFTIHALAPNDVWAASESGLLHYDGTGWAISGPLNTGRMVNVWGTSNDLWVTGYGVWHYNGNTWTKLVTAPTSGVDFPAVWGTGANDVWVAMASVIGYAPTSLMHWDGTEWTTHVSAMGERIGSGLTVGSKTWAFDMTGGIVRLAQ